MKDSVTGKKTLRGHLVMQAVSAFRKSMRRSLEEEALYWAAELDRSGYAWTAWEHVIIMASEDVGLGAPPGTIADLRALYQNWRRFKGRKDPWPARLFLVHAVLILVNRVQKSRAVDHALLVMWHDESRKELPDYSIDKHSKLGRSMDRGEAHWIGEAAKIVTHPDLPAVADRFRERAEKLWLSRDTKGK